MRPCAGDIYATYGFLLFPKTIQGETRWLEYAAWEECCYAGSCPMGDGGWRYIYTKWLNNPKENSRKEVIKVCDMYVVGYKGHQSEDVHSVDKCKCEKIIERQRTLGY